MKRTLISKVKMFFKDTPKLYQVARTVYSALVHPERIIQKKNFGTLNSETTVLIIRPNSQDGMQGLLSLLVQALRWIEYSDRNGYKAVVDYKNYKTQYYVNGLNAWELFFNQPSDLSIDEAYNSKNVILSGVSFKMTVDNRMYRDAIFSDSCLLDKCISILQRHELLTEEVKKIAIKEGKSIDIDQCIGVYIRGTDYVKLKPTGEYKQPDIRDVISKIREFRDKYDNPNIYLVTEDYNYYVEMHKTFGECLKTVSFDNYVKGYDGKDYLYKSGLLEADKKVRGINYLVKVLLLAKCKYFIGSITNGSIIAYCMNKKMYDDEYIFNLGYYD